VWPLPLYELALVTAHRARTRGIPVRMTFVTTEARPLKVFGPAAVDSSERLLDEAGIELFAGEFAQVSEPGRLWLNDRELAADRIVTLPHLRGPVVRGVPAGTGGFTLIDELCRVPNTEGRVFAAGDTTDSPVKHGGLGAQQADAAAAGIAHLAGAAPRPDPLTLVFRGMLLTGRRPLYLVARLIDGVGWDSEVHEQCPWPLDDKVIAEELGPCLAGRAAATVT
jgi:sulfide:quinone oxidoreductase